jgi:hypothetical protein
MINRRPKLTFFVRWTKSVVSGVVLLTAVALAGGASAQSSDALLNTLVKKGILTQQEAENIKAEAEASQTNNLPRIEPSKWKISDGIKSVELFGDLRLRYEYRSARTPIGDTITQRRYRYAFRVGLRGDLADDFYYGFLLDTAANPRSPWGTFGTSTTGVPYQGPYGKSTANIYLGEIYGGWRPTAWFDITAGRMPQPLYTTPMVWDSDYNPEGLAEHLKYTVGQADFFANFGQFLYQEIDPSSASPGFGFNGLTGQNPADVWQIAWQGGLIYHITTNISAKAAATIYQYKGLERSSQNSPNVNSPFYGDPYVGEGAFLGPNSTFPVNGYSGYGTSSGLPGYGSLGFPVNQVGLNSLEILEIPFEINFKFSKLDARVFGDVAYNLEGAERAQAASAAYAYYLANSTPPVSVTAFPPQKNDVKAYQIGFAVASKDALGLVYGSTSHNKHAWEVRTYWQHVEQYALDPNLLDSDFFEGRANLQGAYAAVAYGFSDNVIGSVRGGYASRINDNLGNGGSNEDTPWVNPIGRYELLQMDLTFRF